MLFLLGGFFIVDHYYTSDGAASMVFVPLTLVATVVLLVICVKKGEKAKWHWGRPKSPKGPEEK